MYEPTRKFHAAILGDQLKAGAAKLADALGQPDYVGTLLLELIRESLDAELPPRY